MCKCVHDCVCMCICASICVCPCSSSSLFLYPPEKTKCRVNSPLNVLRELSGHSMVTIFHFKTMESLFQEAQIVSLLHLYGSVMATKQAAAEDKLKPF